MPAQMGHLAGDGAAEGTRGEAFVNLAVERQGHLVTVPASADSAGVRTCRGRERIRQTLRGQRPRPKGNGRVLNRKSLLKR